MKNQISPKVLIRRDQIALKIREVAQEINDLYRAKDLVILLVLKGSICIGADLIRSLEIPFQLEMIRCSSYGMGGAERGHLQIDKFDSSWIENRDILVVDDIFDSGQTMTHLCSCIAEHRPHSLKTLVLLEKRGQAAFESKRPNYILFQIENFFVIGYGLDYKEQYRGLPDICMIEGE